MSWYTPTKIVALRNPRSCEWCGQIMQKKEQAATWGYADGGRMGRVYMHPECEQACLRNYQKHGDEEWWAYSMPRGMTQEEADAA